MNINYEQPLGVIDKQTHHYLSLTKSYPQRHFLCDSCGVEYQSATFYSLAYHESELPYKRVYCENCLKATPAGQKRCQLETKKNPNQKTMPKIEKAKKKKAPKPVTKPTKKLSLPTLKKTKSTKPSPVDYYNCLLTKAQTDWYDPTTGQKSKITACCKDCKLNAPKLQAVRTQEVQKLITSYQQVGESLKKLLKPIN